jgi:hypothetical protein
MQATKDSSSRETAWLQAAEWRYLQMRNREITGKNQAPKFIFNDPSRVLPHIKTARAGAI